MRPRTRRKMASDTPELTAVGEGGIEFVPLDELYGRTQTRWSMADTETTDRPLRDIHVSALIAAALLFQGMESGPGDVILQEALDALIDAKRDGRGFVRPE